MSQLDRHTEFLLRRLASMGIRVRGNPDGCSATGRLELSRRPFETFGDPLILSGARFYTLGHNRLKFFHPPALFDLPALDVSRCHSAIAIEAALRSAWSAAHRDLVQARERLRRLGADIGSAAQGTRLLLALSGLPHPPIAVRSPTEVLLPSSGPLRDRSLAGPAERRFRPPADVQNASELELSMIQSMELRAARQSATPVRERLPAARAAAEAPRGRVLVLGHEARELAESEARLRLSQFEVEALRDPLRALGAFSDRTFDALIVDARMPRMDGLEFTARLREVPGIGELPVVLVDSRPTRANRDAAQAVRAAAYLGRPLDWHRLTALLVDLVEHGNRRRFERFSAKLPVESSATRDLIQTVSRGGFGMRSRRDLFPRAIETYRVLLPLPLSPVHVEGEVAHCESIPGQPTARVGIRIRRFLGESEPRWVRLIERLARRDEEAEATDIVLGDDERSSGAGGARRSGPETSSRARS
jgi:CheY-like chemotaxis protein